MDDACLVKLSWKHETLIVFVSCERLWPDQPDLWIHSAWSSCWSVNQNNSRVPPFVTFHGWGKTEMGWTSSFPLLWPVFAGEHWACIQGPGMYHWRLDRTKASHDQLAKKSSLLCQLPYSASSPSTHPPKAWYKREILGNQKNKADSMQRGSGGWDASEGGGWSGPMLCVF